MRKNMIANMRRTVPDTYLDAFERINYTADINGRVIVNGADVKKELDKAVKKIDTDIEDNNGYQPAR